ncbi:MAG: family efflux transporter subunit [Bacillus sp. (in: firmicutes)]|jgi:HlyD family secretion protein|nr:family efflux transporter subunit [Bacillus sp. (in: firmicutes)]
MHVEHVRNPKKKWIVISVIALIVIIAGMNIMVMQSKNKTSKEDLKFAFAKEREIRNTKLVSGSVVPGNQETFYPDATKGKVKEIFVQEGQQIVKGQKLFTYENPELSIQTKQLDIDKKMTTLRNDQGKSNIENVKKQIEKAKNDGAGNEITGPLESQLQDLQLQQKTSELEMEKNKLQSEELQLKHNELVVVCSIAGIVQKVEKDAGQSTSQSQGAAGKPIVQIASQDPFQVQGTLSELQKAQILPNQPITVSAKAIANKTWKGKITSVSQYPTSDDMGQMVAGAIAQSPQNISFYQFKATLDSQEELSPGYHVSIQVELESKKMLAVPRSSIVEKGDSSFIYVVKGKKLSKQAITMGMGDGEWTEVLEGLKAGDKVVNHPSANVHDGMEVKAK